MSKSQLVLILLTVLLLSIGQILFKLSANDLDIRLLSSFFKFKLFFALSVYFLATILWLIVLRGISLNLAYPFASLGFVIVPVLSYFFIGEQITYNTFLGAIFIFIGIWISVL
jgi:drug/metabolite transporter (DMT)-like permease